jgi:acetyltransferase-like isoleucine patch superfamily enzyme
MTEKEKTGLGKLAAMIEKSLTGLPMGVPATLAEMVSRVGGGLMERSGISQSDGAECRIRGMLAASTMGATGLRIGRGVIMRGRRNIRLGNNVSIGDGVFISATGTQGRVDIGANTHIDVGSVLYGQGGLTIGEDCAIASGVIVYTQTNQHDANAEEKIINQGTRYAPVAIGNDVWIGAGAKILPGVTIEDHAVVGAGSVVMKNVEAWKVVVGVPARVVNDRRGDAK